MNEAGRLCQLKMLDSFVYATLASLHSSLYTTRNQRKQDIRFIKCIEKSLRLLYEFMYLRGFKAHLGMASVKSVNAGRRLAYCSEVTRSIIRDNQYIGDVMNSEEVDRRHPFTLNCLAKTDASSLIDLLSHFSTVIFRLKMHAYSYASPHMFKSRMLGVESEKHVRCGRLAL
jgi:hypothetical protein